MYGTRLSAITIPTVLSVKPARLVYPSIVDTRGKVGAKTSPAMEREKKKKEGRKEERNERKRKKMKRKGKKRKDSKGELSQWISTERLPLTGDIDDTISERRIVDSASIRGRRFCTLLSRLHNRGII